LANWLPGYPAVVRMNDATAALINVSAVLATGTTAELEQVLSEAAAVANATAVEEALLQSYLFLGYPAALRGLEVWRRVSGRPAPGPSSDAAEWQRRGEATCAVVYGGQYERLRKNVARLHPDVEQWMVVEGYGKVLGRPGLDLPTRELCIVALLASQDAAPQLYSHLRGALNAGADEAAVESVIRLVSPMLPPDRAAALMNQWASVKDRRGATES
jgi:4-carboxymuconolactone decarboxylase